MATKADGSLWAWGYNIFGQLGDATYTNRDVPTAVGFDTDWGQIAAGWNHNIAIKTNGTLWAWGNNNAGQLGDGTNTNNNAPIQIGTATNWQSISGGEGHSVAVKTNSTLWAWGSNQFGQLGDGTNNDINIPTQTGVAANWSIIDAGNYFTLGIKTDNTLWTWGNNDVGQLGDGTNTQRNVAVPIGCSLLPVTWLYVQGQLQNKLSLIQWATASESNTKYFEIEFSLNAISYSTVGTVAASGNSSVTKQYQFLQHRPATGKNYYRIKQIDLDGRFNYSSVMVIDVKDETHTISVWPNPAQQFIKISLSSLQQKISLRFFNQQGQLVMQQILSAGLLQQNIDVSKLAAGVYTAQLLTDTGVETVRFIKL